MLFDVHPRFNGGGQLFQETKVVYARGGDCLVLEIPAFRDQCLVMEIRPGQIVLYPYDLAAVEANRPLVITPQRKFIRPTGKDFYSIDLESHMSGYWVLVVALDRVTLSQFRLELLDPGLSIAKLGDQLMLVRLPNGQRGMPPPHTPLDWQLTA